MKAVVLFSGGIDSTVVLAHLIAQKKECLALSFDYNQRHAKELEAAQQIATLYQVPLTIISIDKKIFSQSTSSLLDKSKTPEHFTSLSDTTPSTYVPARNLLFLSHAACLAEVCGATEIYFGANKDDYTHYPDCRKPFFEAFEQAISLGSIHSLRIICPLISFTKKEIIEYGKQLLAPLHLTWSCYNPIQGQSCQKCQACSLRHDLI